MRHFKSERPFKSYCVSFDDPGRVIATDDADDIDAAKEVYGDEIDPSTMPFDMDLICEHVPVTDQNFRTVFCKICGEVL